MTAATFEASLFEHLSTLFSGRSTVRDFRHWFSSTSWESDEELPDELYELASDIEHLGYIRDSDIWDDAAYLRNLRSEIETYCEAPGETNTSAPGRVLDPDQCVRTRVA